MPKGVLIREVWKHKRKTIDETAAELHKRLPANVPAPAVQSLAHVIAVARDGRVVLPRTGGKDLVVVWRRVTVEGNIETRVEWSDDPKDDKWANAVIALRCAEQVLGIYEKRGANDAELLVVRDALAPFSQPPRPACPEPDARS